VTEQEIESKVVEIVAQQMGHDKSKITREMNFTDDLNADSLDQVELVMELEEAFETDIPDEQAEKIKTVGDAMSSLRLSTASSKAGGWPWGSAGLAFGRDCRATLGFERSLCAARRYPPGGSDF